MARSIFTLFAVATLVAAGNPLTAEQVSVQRATTWLLFIDDLHLDFRNTGRIRDLLRNIAREVIQEGDTYAVLSSGPSSIVIDLTSDRAILDSVIRKVTGNGLKPSDVIAADPRGSSEVRYRAHVALTAAHEMTRPFESAPGQAKRMIYLSNGYDVDTSSEAPTPTTRSSLRDVTVAEVGALLTSLPQVAARAGVTIFTIDPRGLVAGKDLDLMLDPAGWEKHLTTTRQHLRTIAEQSGGFTIVDQSAWIKRLQGLRSQ